MLQFLRVLSAVAALITLVVAPVIAQIQPPAPTPERPAPGAPAEPTEKEVEGTVKKVDAGAKSVQISSGLLGLFGATLEVTDETQIQVDGEKGSLTDIREGAKVKASYETREGKNVAKAIEVMPAESKEQAPSGSPAPPAPPAGAPAGATPPPAQPKTQ